MFQGVSIHFKGNNFIYTLYYILLYLGYRKTIYGMMIFDSFIGIDVKDIKDSIEDVSGLMDIKDKIDALDCGIEVTLKRVEYKYKPELSYNILLCKGKSVDGTWFDFCVRKIFDESGMFFVVYVDWIDESGERKRVKRVFNMDMLYKTKCFSNIDMFEIFFKKTVDELYRCRWGGNRFFE